MANTSATGGALPPESVSVPAGDLDLDVILQGVASGITGLPGDLVRPRWQPTQPRMPEIGTDWCAIGVVEILPDNNPAVMHDATGEGHDDLIRHEDLFIMASFYGPHAARNAAILRDGLYVAQNREPLDAAGIGLVTTDTVRMVPALVNEQWQRRADISIILRRIVRRSYPVLNIVSAPVTITPEPLESIHVSVSL